jgi:dipicolinate synthase subunit B
MNKPRIGLAFSGSYCTYDKAMAAAKRMCEKYDVTPIMSENSSRTDSRFGKAEDFKKRLEEYSGKAVIESIKEAEPIGPGRLLDLLVIAPCTGNTLAKIACGITDTSVTMACKAHLRNNRPVLIAVSTNDGLGANAVNLGSLLNRKNIFFVPFFQDDPAGKTHVPESRTSTCWSSRLRRRSRESSFSRC